MSHASPEAGMLHRVGNLVHNGFNHKVAIAASTVMAAVFGGNTIAKAFQNDRVPGSGNTPTLASGNESHQEAVTDEQKELYENCKVSGLYSLTTGTKEKPTGMSLIGTNKVAKFTLSKTAMVGPNGEDCSDVATLTVTGRVLMGPDKGHMKPNSKNTVISSTGEAQEGATKLVPLYRQWKKNAKGTYPYVVGNYKFRVTPTNSEYGEPESLPYPGTPTNKAAAKPKA